MAKAEPKTRPTEANVDDFLSNIANEQQRDDCRAITEMMGRVSGDEPTMWGPAIIGFGSRPIKYASGKELDWPRIAFSPRKEATVLYLSLAVDDFAADLKELGKHKTGKGCLYIKRLADVDRKVLERMIKKAWAKK